MEPHGGGQDSQVRGAKRESHPESYPLPVFSQPLEQALRAADEIFELLPIATCVCDSSGRIVQYNRRAAALWDRVPLPEETYDHFTAQCRYFDAKGDELPRTRLAEVLKTGKRIRNEEVTVERANGKRLVVLLNVDPLFDPQGTMIGAISCFQDITERKQIMDALDRSRQDLRQQEERWNATYEHAAIGIVEIDADGRFLRVNEAISSITGCARDELLDWQLFARTHPDDRDVDAELYRRQVAGDIGFYSIEKRFIRKDGRVIWIAVRSSTVRDAVGGFLYGVRVVQDVTERKEAEERQKLLIDELNHRVKNTLATVQSLATQTARGTHSPEAFRKAFEGRLIALSQAHDQLTRRHWCSADLRGIVAGVTGPYVSRAQDQIVIEGEDITVKPRVALTLAMALHELTTNASKYGALSVPAGRIEIRWEIVRSESAPAQLRIEWHERDGPVVEAPTRHGFGSRFIEGSVAAELQGSARLDYHPTGLVCTMKIPFEADMLDVAVGL